ncbi:unnamed protein product [Vitrella brassicaformis CCMP3155]|uniref:Uncharacterized protein n=1 Tax=Vitrella brassicaformis (strain CCMP3155) TaxID=1169540 RepID=A0A0G4EJ20_VITBC|nr:unnamed protein product [Vitrella brassicaformis CCMP3155]|eukprot:CEL95904.1 unnamed protein product [Vitrella brassicaformis CCMP3155]
MQPCTQPPPSCPPRPSAAAASGATSLSRRSFGDSRSSQSQNIKRCCAEYNAARAELESIHNKLKAASTQEDRQSLDEQMAASRERFSRAKSAMEEILRVMEQAKSGLSQPGRTSEGCKDSQQDGAPAAAAGGVAAASSAALAAEPVAGGEDDAADGSGGASLPRLSVGAGSGCVSWCSLGDGRIALVSDGLHLQVHQCRRRSWELIASMKLPFETAPSSVSCHRLSPRQIVVTSPAHMAVFTLSTEPSPPTLSQVFFVPLSSPVLALTVTEGRREDGGPLLATLHDPGKGDMVEQGREYTCRVQLWHGDGSPSSTLICGPWREIVLDGDPGSPYEGTLTFQSTSAWHERAEIVLLGAVWTKEQGRTFAWVGVSRGEGGEGDGLWGDCHLGRVDRVHFPPSTPSMKSHQPARASQPTWDGWPMVVSIPSDTTDTGTPPAVRILPPPPFSPTPLCHYAGVLLAKSTEATHLTLEALMVRRVAEGAGSMEVLDERMVVRGGGEGGRVFGRLVDQEETQGPKERPQQQQQQQMFDPVTLRFHSFDVTAGSYAR